MVQEVRAAVPRPAHPTSGPRRAERMFIVRCPPAAPSGHQPEDDPPSGQRPEAELRVR